MGATVADRIFTGIGASYDRMAFLLSFGQDRRWRNAAVDAIRAKPEDRVLDVATGTGMVARRLRRRYHCRVVGLDQSADMLAAAKRHAGVYESLHRGHAEKLPFPDASFDHLTFTYLLRYVDDPEAVMRELARVVRPGGRIAMVEFGVPGGIWRPLWWLYTRIGLPVLGRFASAQWRQVGAFLGPSISTFWRRHSAADLTAMWWRAGLTDVTLRRMSLGGGVVMSATRANADLPMPRAPISEAPPEPAPLEPAFYARPRGGWRDYWTLLHPPYTLWHLSYVLLGAAIAPSPDPRIVGGALLAFALAVGVAAHAFDELAGRPLKTEIPASVLVALGSAALVGSIAIGLIGAASFGPAFLGLVALGAAIVLLYALEAPIVHSDIGFALGWGAFPVLATGYACGAHPLPIALASLAAALLSLAQRRLSTRARAIRRRTVSVRGEIAFADGSRETIDARSLIAAPEAALSILWIGVLATAGATLLARWL